MDRYDELRQRRTFADVLREANAKPDRSPGGQTGGVGTAEDYMREAMQGIDMSPVTAPLPSAPRQVYPDLSMFGVPGDLMRPRATTDGEMASTLAGIDAGSLNAPLPTAPKQVYPEIGMPTQVPPELASPMIPPIGGHTSPGVGINRSADVMPPPIGGHTSTGVNLPPQQGVEQPQIVGDTILPPQPEAAPEKPKVNADDMYRLNPTVSPPGQPRLQYANGADRPEPKPEIGLPYSTPSERPLPAMAPDQGSGLAQPSAATRQTGSSGKPDASVAVDSANKMNVVQRLAADWFGVDTPEERARAKTYLANWAATMATSTAGIGSFAEANLAGIEGVNAEEERQLELDLKRENAQMRREQVAYERTRDARDDARQDRRDARDANMDQYRIAEYDRARIEYEEKRAREEELRNDPLQQLADIDDPNIYMAAAIRYASTLTDDPAQAEALAQAMFDRWMATKTKADPLASLMSGLPQ